LAEWDESIFVGDILRFLVKLPNGNFLPLTGKVLYLFADNGIGVKFLDITQFEQELISQIISQNLEEQGLPMQVDVFGLPPTYKPPKPQITDKHKETDEILEDILN
jgi:hypothetical protein